MSSMYEVSEDGREQYEAWQLARVAAERAAARGLDAVAVERVAREHGATTTQARALARKLCGY